MAGWITFAAADVDIVVAEEAAPGELSLKLSVAEYQAQARRQARHYDQTQDISTRQLLMLLEIAERTGAPLGQLLATGEFESAGTWNNFVRPTIGEGSLGSATGVWQFIPNTFFLVIKDYGRDLLAASSAAQSRGWERLDLGAGPFSDSQVRGIIEETVDGTRDADDEQLQLLRHNFTVLAFAKHYLSVASGATTPEEDYLFHFLGETRGRQILALAQAEATAHTLAVRQLGSMPGRVAAGASGRAGVETHTSNSRARLSLRLASARRSTPSSRVVRALPGKVSGRRLRADSRGSERARTDALAESGVYHRSFSRSSRAWPSSDVLTLRSPSSEWGLPADSPIVTGNPGMFYRDASAKTDPYTWAEFMQALSGRVQAHRQPAMVRAKYGVGFELEGADMPEWALDGDKDVEMVELRDPAGGNVLLAKKLVTAPLDADEMQAYKERLAELIARGEAEPLVTVPSSAVLAFQRLGVLTGDVTELAGGSPELRKALASFRELVGKDEPDDPSLVDRLMPAERVALEIYDRRLAQYSALQSAQQAAVTQAVDLLSINRLLKSHRRASRPHIAALQKALDDEGLQTQTRRHQSAGARHFDGIAGKLTVAALDRFQLQNGLRQTQGRYDAVTAATLGLPPLGPHIFLVPVGPQCPLVDEAAAMSALNWPMPTADGGATIYELLRMRKDASPKRPDLLFAQVEHEQTLSAPSRRD